jgi:hypothetical protein
MHASINLPHFYFSFRFDYGVCLCPVPTVLHLSHITKEGDNKTRGHHSKPVLCFHCALKIPGNCLVVYLFYQPNYKFIKI